MTAGARVVQISVSAGGVPKRPVPAARVTTRGLEGDAQRDREHHGGLERIRGRDGRVYARVRREGSLASGEPVQLLTEDVALTLIGHR
jgi:MOSC domain-containing protein YiiM